MSDSPNEAADKSPAEAAVEALVYAPIGLLFEGASLLPQLVEKGRNQVTMARMLGQFAVKQAGEEAIKASARLQDQAAGVLDFIGGSVAPVPADPPPHPAPSKPASTKRPTAGPSAGAARDAARRVAGGATTTDSSAASTGKPAAEKPATKKATTKRAAAKKAPARRPTARKAAPTKAAPKKATAGQSAAASAPTPGSLAITDYDGLSASHVVNRLEGLSTAELEAVRQYEAANRGRKTILSRVAQLQSS